MGVWIQITPGTGVAIYAQIVSQVQDAVARGELNAGDRLPAVRALAEELVLNPNTVARAYRELERGGLVVTKAGAGTFISAPELRRLDARDLHQLGERLDTLLARGLSMGLSATDLQRLFKQRLQRFKGEGKAE